MTVILTKAMAMIPALALFGSGAAYYIYYCAWRARTSSFVLASDERMMYVKKIERRAWRSFALMISSFPIITLSLYIDIFEVTMIAISISAVIMVGGLSITVFCLSKLYQFRQ